MRLPTLPTELITKIIEKTDIDTRRAFNIYGKVTIPDGLEDMLANMPKVCNVLPFGDYAVGLGHIADINGRPFHLYTIQKFNEVYHNSLMHVQTFVLHRDRETRFPGLIASYTNTICSTYDEVSNHVFYKKNVV